MSSVTGYTALKQQNDNIQSAFCVRVGVCLGTAYDIL